MVFCHFLAVHEPFGLCVSIDRELDLYLSVAEVDNGQAVFASGGGLSVLVASCDDRQGAEQQEGQQWVSDLSHGPGCCASL